MEETLDTKRNRPGDRFFATLVQPILVQGGVVVPRGTYCAGHLVESKPSGRFKGRARPYRIGNAGAPRLALTVALANNCDAVVATVLPGRALEPDQERAVYALLNSEAVLRWAEANSGYQYR